MYCIGLIYTPKHVNWVHVRLCVYCIYRKAERIETFFYLLTKKIEGPLIMLFGEQKVDQSSELIFLHNEPAGILSE